MPKQRLLTVLLAAAALLVLLSLATLIPSSGARSDLGYSSWCPFAPWSSLVLLAGAGLVWVIRGYLKTQQR